jgi:hypothetical protein
MLNKKAKAKPQKHSKWIPSLPMQYTKTYITVFSFQKTLPIVLISTTVAELISLLSLAGDWRQLRSDIMAPKESIMCLPLQTLISVEDDRHQCPDGLKEKVNKTEETEETILCCGSRALSSIKFPPR